MQFFLHFLLFQLSQFNIFDTFNKFITETIPYGIPASMSVRLGQSFDTMYDVILSGGGLQNVFENYLLSTSDVYAGVLDYAQIGYNALAAFGCSVCILYWFLGIVDKLTKDRLTGYELLRSGIEIMVAFMFITEGFNLFRAILNFGDYAYDLLTPTAHDWQQDGQREYTLFFGDGSYGGVPVSEWNNVTTWDTGLNDGGGTSRVHGLGGMVGMIIPLVKAGIIALGSSIGCVIGVANMVSRMIQMCVYAIFSPLAIADLFNGGIMNSPGMRFMKKFLAVALQGAVIFVIIQVTMMMQRSFLVANAGGMGNAFMMAVPSFIMVTLILKSQQISNDLVGV